MTRLFSLLVVVTLFSVIRYQFTIPPQAQSAPQVTVLRRDGTAAVKITDGDLIRLRLDLEGKASQAIPVKFSLDVPGKELAVCTIPVGSKGCESEAFSSLGWHWSAGEPADNRMVIASADGGAVLASNQVQVAARPVVMVHGFSSDWRAWENYLGPGGFLAGIGVPGFAVGDGQVSGVMNTGNISNPAGQTNTIAENAAILGEYIAEVKKATGAEQVDLAAHSMGGMISRYYLDRVMAERDVVQLMMLGSPAGGTDCANLPASLGFYLPATLEIRPSYAYEIFNRQITRRKGVPFYALAGIPIVNPVGSPCADVPSDIVISRQSVSAVPLNLSEISVLHVDLNTSRQVFDEFVAPLLKKGPGEYADGPDTVTDVAATAPLQFTHVFTGHVAPGESQNLIIPIDPNVTVASFALYDPSLSLDVTVRGASGKAIELSPEKNGLIQVDDPQSMVHLGYGFANPKPGAWQVTLHASDQTPARGADYALTAQFIGGAVLRAASSNLIPEQGEAVQITAVLELNGQPIPVEQAEAAIRSPDGKVETIQLLANADRYEAVWEPTLPGLYAVDVHVTGETPDGSPVDRAAFLTLEVQPRSNQARTTAILAGTAIVLVGIVVLGIGAVVWLVRRSRRPR